MSRGRVTTTLLPVVVSLVIAVLFLGGIEVSLRLLDLGEQEMSRLPYQKVYLPPMVEGTRADGTEVFRTADVRLPYQSIRAQKPANSLRVFVFGASAAAGLGFGPRASFAMQLERILRRAYPEREVELVNFSIVAIPARSVQMLLSDTCRRYDPDLAIVYSGNNEFMEIHAKKFLEAEATFVSRIRDSLTGMRMSRLLNQAVRGSEIPTLAEQDATKAQIAEAEHTIIHDVKITQDEILGIMDAYEQTLQDMADVARETETPLLLMTVASNWRWRGPRDLPDGWVGELLGKEGPATPEGYREVVELLTRKLDSGPRPAEHQDLAYRRAMAHEALGEFEAARSGFREAKDADLHLRRALSQGNDRVRRVALRNGTPLLDTVEFLQGEDIHGIIGSEEIYDNVHFTPRGAALVAGELFERGEALGLFPEAGAFDLQAYMSERLALLASMEEDFRAVNEWLGVGDDPGQVARRDPWKYDRMRKTLDRRVEENPRDVRALIYRGNIHYYRIQHARDAEKDYRAALALQPDDPIIRGNLELLLSEAR